MLVAGSGVSMDGKSLGVRSQRDTDVHFTQQLRTNLLCAWKTGKVVVKNSSSLNSTRRKSVILTTLQK